MDKARKLFWRRSSYEQLDDGADRTDEDDRGKSRGDRRFSWMEYGVFLVLGIAMLWSWNMFLAAAPYFQQRFRTNKALLANFQATEVSVSTLSNLGCMIILTKLQANASYPRRIIISLVAFTVTFMLLAVSTKAFTSVSAAGYFGFMVVMVLISSSAVGFMQNGIFSLVPSYGRPEYMQAILAGQAVAGVLPPLVQIFSVLSTGEHDGTGAGAESSTSAFVYFLAATAVSTLALLAFSYLLRYHPAHRPVETAASASDTSSLSPEEDPHSAPADAPKASIPLTHLARKLFFPASAVFITFGVTMLFPVFTQEITSVTPQASPLLADAAFIPLAFLVWNAGDLTGRLIPLAQKLSLAHRPKTLLLLSLARVVFIPLYFLCNITPVDAEVPSSAGEGRGRGAVMPDWFYLIVVQMLFGLTNGYLGSCTMMGAPSMVDEEEREAAGGFMGLCLVGGLAVGSLCSFFVGNA